MLDKSLTGLFFGINIFITLFGFFTLYDSPYTGIRLAVCGRAACVKSVDPGSPAAPAIRAGDLLVDVNDLSVSPLAFHPDPDHIRSRKELLAFWKDRQKLSEPGTHDKSVRLLLEREGSRFDVKLAPARFPLARALARTGPICLVGWTFMAVAWLVLRRKANEISRLNFFMGSLVCMNFAVLAPFLFRDIFFPAGAFRMMYFINAVTYLAFSCSLLHMMLIFPHRKQVLLRAPWLTAGPYLLFAVMAIVHFAGVFDNAHLTLYGATNACMLIYFGRLLYDYFAEKSALYKKQIQWVVFGVIGGITFWLSATSMPIMFGSPLVAEELSVLPTVLYPLCFAFAVTRYRLMDIDSIFDYSVIYGFTIIFLAGVELTFLRFVSPYFLAAGGGLPYVSLFAVLLIVFIYVPVRNAVKGAVERLLRRGSYDMQKEMQGLTVSLGISDNVPKLEKFAAFIKGLLGPSGLFVVGFEPSSSPAVLYADTQKTLSLCGLFLSSGAQKAWAHAAAAGACTYGYELSERGLWEGAAFGNEAEGALFVPFLPDPGNRARGFLAVLLRKQSDAPYSKKDMSMLNAISLSIANIIAAEELRRERDELEARFRREKEGVMKELHDGLGNILTNISVASQAALRVCAGEPDKAADMVGRMSDYSAEAMDFLRTGLMVLDNPEREMGDILEGISARYGELFSAYGLELRLETWAGAGGFRPGAAVAMDLTRSVQEALTNVVKHSGAGNVCISLSRKEDLIEVAVRDDGRGFSPEGKKKGFGLRNIASRMHKLHGSMEILSAPGKGTTVKLILPASRNGA